MNWEAGYTDTVPIIRESRMLLPIRFVAELLGAAVAWNGGERKVTVAPGARIIEPIVSTLKTSGEIF